MNTDTDVSAISRYQPIISTNQHMSQALLNVLTHHQLIHPWRHTLPPFPRSQNVLLTYVLICKSCVPQYLSCFRLFYVFSQFVISLAAANVAWAVVLMQTLTLCNHSSVLCWSHKLWCPKLTQTAPSSAEECRNTSRVTNFSHVWVKEMLRGV